MLVCIFIKVIHFTLFKNLKLFWIDVDWIDLKKNVNKARYRTPECPKPP